VHDFGIDISEFLNVTSPHFYELPLDHYDSRKEQIVYLQDRLPAMADPAVEKLCFEYYNGERDAEFLKPYIALLNEADQKEFALIVPFRRRAVANFILKRTDAGWEYTRKPTPPFSQTYAKIAEERFDFRSLPRRFSEIDDKLISDGIFPKLLKGVAAKVGDIHPEVNSLDITAHHVMVTTRKVRPTSNSPEGIHQDGYDYIVSALVVERRKVKGGVSEIFTSDKKTRILSTVLQPGFGILQPDLNTSLWHHVTKIDPEEDEGFRSSIGFDIALN
ncbi:MAG: 2OG-Fe dioxygenase family protein, partial [Chlamydiia bacterium]|nr:2OG-Fe dioxygenase family protein [Chlamydiia bacterium]